jgi:Spy/CpxP family protein refolding chaperone
VRQARQILTDARTAMYRILAADDEDEAGAADDAAAREAGGADRG